MKSELWWIKHCRCNSGGWQWDTPSALIWVGSWGLSTSISHTPPGGSPETYFCTSGSFLTLHPPSSLKIWDSSSQKCRKERLSDLCIHLFIYTQRRHFNIVINNNEAHARARAWVHLRLRSVQIGCFHYCLSTDSGQGQWGLQKWWGVQKHEHKLICCLI